MSIEGSGGLEGIFKMNFCGKKRLGEEKKMRAVGEKSSSYLGLKQFFLRSRIVAPH